ncbi:FAD-dependent oxidoreductase [Chloroflexota bacterium]
MQVEECEYVIVGSGAGGATLAKELTSRHKRVIVVEMGSRVQGADAYGRFLRKTYPNRVINLIKEWKAHPVIYKAITAGGSTVISHGNGVRCLEEELSAYGISLDSEFNEAEKEMRIAPIAEELLSEGSINILQASRELGYRMERMPKFIDPLKCKRCGECTNGCMHGAKWTALDYLQKAINDGAKVLYNTRVDGVIIDGGVARGIRGTGLKGQVKIIADTVIITAGGLSTPVILQRSGIEAGRGLFVDLTVDTYGVTNGFNQLGEVPTTLIDTEFYRSKGFILLSFVSQHRMTRFVKFGVKGLSMPEHKLIGIITKIRDEPSGYVQVDGAVCKPVTAKDRARLREGSLIAGEILVGAGADRGTLVVSKPQGGHPGGTAAIGVVVNSDLQTQVRNLFVCDASVLPTAPGLPPILTIIALAKRLSKTLSG